MKGILKMMSTEYDYFKHIEGERGGGYNDVYCSLLDKLFIHLYLTLLKEIKESVVERRIQISSHITDILLFRFLRMSSINCISKKIIVKGS